MLVILTILTVLVLCILLVLLVGPPMFWTILMWGAVAVLGLVALFFFGGLTVGIGDALERTSEKWTLKRRVVTCVAIIAIGLGGIFVCDRLFPSGETTSVFGNIIIGTLAVFALGSLCALIVLASYVPRNIWRWILAILAALLFVRAVFFPPVSSPLYQYHNVPIQPQE